jgi:hypothetical protein
MIKFFQKLLSFAFLAFFMVGVSTNLKAAD